MSYDRRLKDKNKSLKGVLLSSNRLRWLDLGSSSSFNEGFYFADLHPPSDIPETMRDKYFRLNILKPDEDELKRIGKFDLIRMQHVFEHFSMEDGLKVLERCSDLLDHNGYLLITVPDLRIFVTRYRCRNLQSMLGFKEWALTRIPADSPESFFFSIFTHSVPNQQHLWCYDEEGLKFQLSRTGKFKNIRRISLFNSLSDIPFTHNRPDEDLCILAQKA